MTYGKHYRAVSHLSYDEIDSILLDEDESASTESLAHIFACPACRTMVEDAVALIRALSRDPAYQMDTLTAKPLAAGGFA